MKDFGNKTPLPSPDELGLPWSVEPETDDSYPAIVDKDGDPCLLLDDFDPSVLDFILRACNSHHSLTNALRDCLESLRRLPDVDGAYRVTCIAEAEAALAGGNVPQSNVALAAAKEDGK